MARPERIGELASDIAAGPAASPEWFAGAEGLQGMTASLSGDVTRGEKWGYSCAPMALAIDSVRFYRQLLTTSHYTIESTELIRLRNDLVECGREIDELEQETERLENALLELELSVLQGYAVALWPVGDGTFLATCPRLHASVQEDSKEKALRSLTEAIKVVKDGMAHFGDPLPPPDIE